MADDNIYNFFGEPDAKQETETLLKEYYQKPKLVNRLKIENKIKGCIIVAGVKGSGKTHICRMLERKSSDIIWKLDNDDQIEINKNPQQPSGYYQSYIVVYLLSKFLERVVKVKNSFSPTAQNSLPTMLSRLIEKASKFLSSSESDPGGIKLQDIAKLINIPLEDLKNVNCKDFKQVLELCLKERKGYILIDDVDDVFPGIDYATFFL